MTTKALTVLFATLTLSIVVLTFIYEWRYRETQINSIVQEVAHIAEFHGGIDGVFEACISRVIVRPKIVAGCRVDNGLTRSTITVVIYDNPTDPLLPRHEINSVKMTYRSGRIIADE